MNILALDTSNRTLSVALLADEVLLADMTLNIKKNHSITLMPTIDFLMAQVGWMPADLDRLVVAQGPGSYTGLRIAVATAKVLAQAHQIDLVGVSSLEALLPDKHSGIVVPLIDARRNNVYTGFYENGRAVVPDGHRSFEDVLAKLQEMDLEQLTFVGETTAFAEQIAIAFPEAVITPSLPCAYHIGRLGASLEPVDIDSFEPCYLKRVEAEENWLKNHEESDRDDYIKRV
ncbi:tRNA (adenosine(37)-N6)-threonylcarbamoyltransferase complex dimerization subunit type 1 TsaB [Streptococcus merionis]|uniref:tRNA (adenosine(37)-N6)-threonylcarbamoyltransferase complex dimerization subunit type 1 TsaB n=1 Tax=Streptococcus merionis TaxID=400065 RepID=UPI0035175B58